MRKQWMLLPVVMAACISYVVVHWYSNADSIGKSRTPAIQQHPRQPFQPLAAISSSSSAAGSVSSGIIAEKPVADQGQRYGQRAEAAADSPADSNRGNSRAQSSSKDGNSTLLKMYMARYQEMKMVPKNIRNETCPPVLNSHKSPCWVQGCNASFLPLQERLGHVLRTQQPITKEQRQLIDRMADHSKHVDVVFLTAASSDHFDETQGLIKDLHQQVFPELQRQGRHTFHFFYYDLGLTPQQLQKLKAHCNCTVRPFPFAQLPSQFHKLGTCIWKPLVMKAHLGFSHFTVWMDASTRFRTSNITPILQQAQRLGILVARNNFMMPKHVHPAMLSYFQVQPCLLASFYETAGGFVALHNEDLVHKAIVDPWVACAFSPKCLCPSERMTDCQSYLPCKVRQDPYFQCHRFDQSALGIILALLFDWRVTELTHGLVQDTTPWFAFRRGHRVKYFP